MLYINETKVKRARFTWQEVCPVHMKPTIIFSLTWESLRKGMFCLGNWSRVGRTFSQNPLNMNPLCTNSLKWSQILPELIQRKKMLFSQYKHIFYILASFFFPIESNYVSKKVLEVSLMFFSPSSDISNVFDTQDGPF